MEVQSVDGKLHCATGKQCMNDNLVLGNTCSGLEMILFQHRPSRALHRSADVSPYIPNLIYIRPRSRMDRDTHNSQQAQA